MSLFTLFYIIIYTRFTRTSYVRFVRCVNFILLIHAALFRIISQITYLQMLGNKYLKPETTH